MLLNKHKIHKYQIQNIKSLYALAEDGVGGNPNKS